MRFTLRALNSRVSELGFRDFARSLQGGESVARAPIRMHRPKFDLEQDLRSSDIESMSDAFDRNQQPKIPSSRKRIPTPPSAGSEAVWPGRDIPLNLKQSRLVVQIKAELEYFFNSHECPQQLSTLNWSMTKLFLSPTERTCFVAWTHLSPSDTLSLMAVTTMLEAYQIPLSRLLKHRIRQGRYFPRIRFIRDSVEDIYTRSEAEAKAEK
ncbi:hypothetical protein SmJEL517_g03462 [Synchytrium microbalum]|uniref:Uncharacterized protein n=1 Tax=Synchytrium microbalum TaxID=1806994 RepID=A0A507C3Q3_9FUNG|nr:uncharacterized protein SmJEL517_g03462 [Synchytrium microbalum]TPX33699.1 hypothetical protein SmJEL517_g03462 [Synchytrium microbalum]